MAPRNSMLDAGGASDSEDDLATKTTFTSGASTAAKLKAMGAANRRGSTTTATKRKAPAKTTQNNRQALKDRTNVQDHSDAEDVEDDYGAKPKSKRAKTTAAAPQKPTRAPAKSKTTNATNKRVPATEALAVIPETQPSPHHGDDISQSIEDVDAEMDVTNIPTPPRHSTYIQRARSTSVQPAAAPLPVRASARSVSAQPGYPPPRERSGSASATERRGGDPELRRQLNDVTKKHENLKLKYQSLQEVGNGNAQFEKLRSATEKKARESEEVIAALKKEVSELKKAGSGSGAASDPAKETASRLTTENKDLKSSLQTAENEKKALEAKLMAARQQIANSATQDTKKASEASSLPANATDLQKELKMKENLYSDLTGLIIRGVKRKEGEDEYDCIQTGRNGTLHFHLSIANDSSISNPKTPSGMSYEEAEFAYEPFLDEARDKNILDLLPDYLCEDICFPRTQAVKFYDKIFETMSRRRGVD